MIRAGSIGRDRDRIADSIFHPPEEAGSFFPRLPRRNQRLYGAKRTVQASGPRPKCGRRAPPPRPVPKRKKLGVGKA